MSIHLFFNVITAFVNAQFQIWKQMVITRCQVRRIWWVMHFFKSGFKFWPTLYSRTILSHSASTSQLFRNVELERQWINKSTVGPSRLSVRDNPSRTNNSLDSFHAALRRRIKVGYHIQTCSLSWAIYSAWRLTARHTSASSAVEWPFDERRSENTFSTIQESRLWLRRFDDNVYSEWVSEYSFLTAHQHN